jgi:hypothetical protein
MTYFIDPYTKYYEKLSGASSMSSDAASITSGMTESRAIVQGLNSTVSTSNWNELGLQQISQNIFPAMMEYGEQIANNIENVLTAAASKATGELLPEVTKLKEEDEKLDGYKEELDKLVVVPQYDSEGKETDAYRSYKNKKSELEGKISESKTKCEEIKSNCDSIVAAIKALDAQVEEKEFSVSAGGGAESTDGSQVASGVSVIGSVEGGKMIAINVDGKEFYVANTRISVVDYEKYVQSSGLYQNTGFMGSQCSTLAQVYGVDMMRGTYTARSTDAVDAQSPCTRMLDGVSSPNEEDVLQYLYNELTAGRVCSLQATQVQTATKGWRHVVTVVGFDSSVKSWKDLNPDTILVLDCVDGKIQTLGKSRSSGGHERKLYAQGGKYMAHGATQDFLVKEVNNSDWQAKHGKGNTTVTA